MAPKKPSRPVLVLLIFSLMFISLRIIFPERGFDDTGFHAILDSLFSIFLFGLAILLANGTGKQTLSLIFPQNQEAEYQIYCTALGLGILAYGVLAMGLAGILYPISIALWLLLAGAFSLTHLKNLLTSQFSHLRELRNVFRNLTLPIKFLLGISLIILSISFFNTLAPATDYDGLMYHLQAPELFLRAGKIYIINEIWQANGPSTIEMLYAIGLSFGTDSFARLINFGYLILLLVSTYVFAKKYFSEEHGWLSIAILIGIPFLSILASWAYTDFGRALYELLGVWAILNWKSCQNARWLIVAGMMMGLAMGIKYLAITTAGLIGLWIILESLKTGYKNIFYNLLVYGIPALLVPFPWYAKNWILGKNPFYPLYLPTPGWDNLRISLSMSNLNSFGVGHTIQDYILLPFNLYFNHIHFTSSISNEMPSLLFPIALFYLFRRDKTWLNKLGLYAIAWFCIWAIGSQQGRFLLPIFPILAFITSEVLYSIPSLRLKRILIGTLIGATLGITLAYQLAMIRASSPLMVITGQESKADFLRKNLPGYKAMEYINKNLSGDTNHVLFLWDGRSYYCNKLCIPESDINWIYLTQQFPTTQSLAKELRRREITHIMLNYGSLLWYQKYRDTEGNNSAAYKFLIHQFAPVCGKEIYRDNLIYIYKLTCH